MSNPVTPPRPPWVALISIALATCVVHFVFGVYYTLHPRHPEAKLTLQTANDEYLLGWRDDSAKYNCAALGVLHTGVPRNESGGISIRTPAYDYFLAACYRIGGVRLLPVAIPQAVLSGLTSLLVGLIAFLLAGTSATVASWLAALMVQINLRFAIFVGGVMPTSLLLFLFAGAVYAAVLGLRTRWELICFVGALVLAVFTQAAFFVVAFAAAVWLGMEFVRDKRPALAVAAVTLLGFVGMRLLLSRLELGGNRADDWRAGERGAILWEHNNPYYESMDWMSLWEQRPGNAWTQWRMSATEQQRFTSYMERAGGEGSRAAFLWIRENPAQYAKLCLIRLRTELGPFTAMMSPRNQAISAGYWLMIFPVGWYGLWQLRRQAFSRLVVLVILAILSFDALVAVEWYLRYRLPVDLILTAYASVVYAGWLTRRSCPTASAR